MIYDCFTFLNENLLLEIRLNELNSVVDKFVIVEATKTHSGKLRKLCFNKNNESFKPFLNKIIYIPIDFPNDLDVNYIRQYINLDHVKLNTEAWLREIFQRNSISKGLKNAKSNDIIMISDVDEIPNRDQIIKLKNIKNYNKKYAFEQNFFYYYFNLLNISEKWIGTKATLFKNLTTPQELRYSTNYEIIKNGGWHFSYLGDINKIKNKIDSFAHQEFNNKRINNNQHIQYSIKNNLDLFERPIKFKVVEFDKSFPNYILANQNKFKELIKKDKKIDNNTEWLINKLIDSRKNISVINNQLNKLLSEKNVLVKSNKKLLSEKNKLEDLIINKFIIENQIESVTNHVVQLNKELYTIKSAKFYKLWQAYNKIKKLF